MDNQAKEFLFKYLNNASPTGFESSGQQIWLDYIRPYIDSYISDTYGTLVGVVNPDAPYKVVIEAHADEISWFVHYITDDGYIYLKRNGGSDALIAPSMRVNIWTEKGPVKAVFGWPAIHVREIEKDQAPKVKDIFLDCGATSKQEVLDLGIQIGCVATFEDEMIELGQNYLTGRALDNRIGGYMIAQVLRRIKEAGTQLPFGLYVVNSVQEEIGLRGAEMIAERIKPNVAIITDVTHDTYSPMYKKLEQGDIKCGNGPVLTFGPAVQNNLLKLIFKAAEDNGIAVQRQVASRFTGTDTDAFAYAAGGIASALISLPLKYMHTTVETVHKDDVEKVIDLIHKSVLAIRDGQDFRYIQ